MRSDLSETGNPSNPGIIQYTFSEDHTNALQQAKSFSRIACMHNPNFKEFLRKLDECENPPTPKQLKALEIIIQREKDFIRPSFIKNDPYALEHMDLDHMILINENLEMLLSLKIMQEAIAALKGQESNGRLITKKSVQEVQAEILKKLEEHRESLIKITNRSLSSTGVVIEDKRGRESVVRLFLSYHPDSKDEAVRFQREMQSLQLTPAQINYLKMSLNQENFPGTIKDIIPYIESTDIALRAKEIATMKITVDVDSKVYVELSRTSVLEVLKGGACEVSGAVFQQSKIDVSGAVFQQSKIDVSGAVFQQSKIDISNIAEEQIVVGSQTLSFPKDLPQPTAVIVTAGCTLKKQGIKTTPFPKNSMPIIQEITTNCGIRDVLIVEQQAQEDVSKKESLQALKASVEGLRDARRIQQNQSSIANMQTISLSLENIEQQNTNSNETLNLSNNFLQNMIEYITQLIDSIVLKVSSLTDSADHALQRKHALSLSERKNKQTTFISCYR